MSQSINEAILRIQKMEKCFDTLQENMEDIDRELLEVLTEYYDGGQWLSDYQLDEQGLLPKDLKRAVLSEDAVYNFLDEVRQGMSKYEYITLREKPELMDRAADWFHSKWRVPREAYVECMSAYLNGETDYGWFLCLHENQIVGGLAVIENDFHDRKDLTPNICAVYVEENHRKLGIAGHLLDMAVENLRGIGVSPVYLITDHTGFYERYGWEFLCMVQGDGEPEMTRMYVHK